MTADLQKNDGPRGVQRSDMFTPEQVATADGSCRLVRGPAAGPPLLFLHGVGRCWQDFVPLMTALSSRWQVCGLDFRGHGRSSRTPDKYLVRDYVRDALSAFRHIGQPIVLYGHSLGALVAALSAAELGDQVRGAILEDPPLETLGPGIEQTPFYAFFQLMRAVCASSLDVRALAQHLADARVPATGFPDGVRVGDVRDGASLRFFAACLKRIDPQLWEPLLAGRWLEGYHLDQELPKIACPTLLLQGDVLQGGMLEDGAACRAERLIPDCIRIPVAGVGHLIHTLKHEETVRLGTGFLESIALTDPLFDRG